MSKPGVYDKRNKSKRRKRERRVIFVIFTKILNSVSTKTPIKVLVLRFRNCVCSTMFSILDINELYISLYVYQMHYNHLVCIDVECEL